MRKRVWVGLATALLMCIVGGTALAITDDEVVQAIEKAKQALISQQGADGAWPEIRPPGGTADYGHTETVFYTLAYMDESPNRDYMDKALNAVLTRTLDYTYAISMRCMGLAHIRDKFAKTSQKHDMVDKALKLDAMWLCQAQGSHGGWDYKTLSGSEGRFDFSNTQLAVLALREAALKGVEIPDGVWRRTQKLYFDKQQKDGSWNYGDPGNAGMGASTPGYGSMSAAGLASIFITMDNLDLASGCPCKAGASNRTKGDFERRLDIALRWLEDNFKPDANPKFPGGEGSFRYYWMYAVERVGIAAGYKYFGKRNWYKEGAEILIKEQGGNGMWGSIPDTCFATLFLYKGRTPILYNKLEFKGEWNMHRRDVANVTTYIEKTKEQIFQWQIVNLQAPVEEFHDAPILYITAESVPEFTDTDKKKLREFTDTGGTILLEASCGSPAVRKWATDKFFKEVWPEYPLKPLGPDHGSFVFPNPLKQRPEILGLDDGLRTFLFYSMDDFSCWWQTKAHTGRDYLFKWAINLFTYATDSGPLRAKLAPREDTAVQTDRYATVVKGGDKNSLTLARVKYGTGPDWMVNRNYKPFARLAKTLQEKASVTLNVDENGVAPAALGTQNVAYLAGAGALALTPQDVEGLKAYVSKGGFLWVEAAGGASAFDASFRKTAAEAGWELKPFDKTSPMVSGKLAKAVGYNLGAGVQFQRSLRVARLGRNFAELVGIYQGGKLIGVYSPFDVMFSLTGYDAYGCRGYNHPDALATAMNIVLYQTDRPAD